MMRASSALQSARSYRPCTVSSTGSDCPTALESLRPFSMGDGVMRVSMQTHIVAGQVHNRRGKSVCMRGRAG